MPRRPNPQFIATRPVLAEYFGHVFGVSLLHVGVENFDDHHLADGSADEGGSASTAEMPVLPEEEEEDDDVQDCVQ